MRKCEVIFAEGLSLSMEDVGWRDVYLNVMVSIDPALDEEN